jgi:hypothetical protein
MAQVVGVLGEIESRKTWKVSGRHIRRKMEMPKILQTTPFRKVSARKPKGEPEIAAVTGCNGWFRVRKQEQGESRGNAERPAEITVAWRHDKFACRGRMGTNSKDLFPFVFLYGSNINSPEQGSVKPTKTELPDFLLLPNPTSALYLLSGSRKLKGPFRFSLFNL